MKTKNFSFSFWVSDRPNSATLAKYTTKYNLPSYAEISIKTSFLHGGYWVTYSWPEDV